MKDTGEGIAKDKCEIIFDRFTQADNSLSKKHEGTGVGLSIAKAFVEMLGGRISVNSQVDKGSAFYITIPINNMTHKI